MLFILFGYSSVKFIPIWSLYSDENPALILKPVAEINGVDKKARNEKPRLIATPTWIQLGVELTPKRSGRSELYK